MSVCSALAELLWPPVCAACGITGAEPFCGICSDALEPASSFEVAGARAAHALWIHGGPAAIAVQQLKFHDRPELARPLGLALRAALVRLAPVELVVPVPLSSRRLAQRGYNQARELMRELGLREAPRALVRTHDQPPQVGLSREARLANLRHAIGAGGSAAKDRHVLLIDDVVTTGATSQACVQALLGAGARSVQVLALTHAENSHS